MFSSVLRLFILFLSFLIFLLFCSLLFFCFLYYSHFPYFSFFSRGRSVQFQETLMKIKEIYEVFTSSPKTGTNTSKVRKDFSRLCRVLVGLESDHWSSSCHVSSSESYWWCFAHLHIVHSSASYGYIQYIHDEGHVRVISKIPRTFPAHLSDSNRTVLICLCHHHVSCPEGHYSTQFVVLCECIFEKSSFHKVSFE